MTTSTHSGMTVPEAPKIEFSSDALKITSDDAEFGLEPEGIVNDFPKVLNTDVLNTPEATEEDSIRTTPILPLSSGAPAG